MTYKWTTTFLIMAVLIMNVCGQTCIPADYCASAVAFPGSLVPDPIDCEKFYTCITNPSGGDLIPSSIAQSCPEGNSFVYNSTSGIGSCEREATPGICLSACGSHVCTTTCPTTITGITYIADETDCQSFYLCTQLGTIINSCPPLDPYFNGFGCVADKSQCCQCRPLCVEAGTLIQDPCACHSYYVCSSLGQAHSNVRGTCPTGTHFDTVSGSCITGSTCTSRCTTCPT